MLSMLLQFGGLKITALSAGHSFIWIASGISCGLLFLRGESVLPGIFLGGFFAYFFDHLPLWPSIEIALILSLQPFLILRFCYRYLLPTLIFATIRQCIIFMAVSCLLTAISTRFMLTVCHPYLHLSKSIDDLWLRWWLANWTGLIIYAPAIQLWDTYYPDLHAVRNKKPLYMHALLLLVSSLIFHITSCVLSAGLVLSVLSYIGWRFGRLGFITGLIFFITTSIL